MPRFRVSDNSLNSQGFRVISEGADVSGFSKNPIMLWMHQRYFMPGDPLPIGRWENLKLENSEWTADPVFDEQDEFAVKIQNKVDSGIINMTSIGLRIIELSDDPSVLVPGQTRPTITRWELQEISFADIGANKNAIRLYNKEGAEITLADGQDNPILPLIKTYKMKAIALKIGLAETSTEDQVILKAGEMLVRITDLEKANGELSDANKKLTDEKHAAIVDEAIAQKKITADKRESFMKMAASDLETTKAVLSSIPDGMKPSDVIKKGKGDQGDGEWKTLTEKGRDAVEKFRSENPDEYKKLFCKHYGYEPSL
ncbi:MAG: hypothetical protein NT004_06230 [Bacteroidetes bacterium]|nr:hypothetical protein [Bacteroidota bacterium]